MILQTQRKLGGVRRIRRTFFVTSRTCHRKVILNKHSVVQNCNPCRGDKFPVNEFGRVKNDVIALPLTGFFAGINQRRLLPIDCPGLAIRIIGEVTEESLHVLKEADAIVREEIRASGLHDNIWQAFAVLLPIKTVGVMGDERTYENVLSVRAVQSLDGMTADWFHLPYELLSRMSNRIINEVRGVNRVVYDISSKPPATIEWE